ncbi:MAG: zinc ribbon domain-containing protein [bacterium]
MTATRYKEARILTRGLQRLPGENRSVFKEKVLRLRRHFQQFNLDASELCQWLMSLRPDGKNGSMATTPFWEFILNPDFGKENVDNTDRFRRMIFDVVIGLNDEKSVSSIPVSTELIDSVNHVASLQLTETAAALFQRLREMNPAHRQVLIKAATEWIVARYQRSYENWEKHDKAWEKEKNEWEEKNPELTEDVRQTFNKIFTELDITRNTPRRICDWERLKELKNNCLYAGEKIEKQKHGRSCCKYNEFLKNHADVKNIKKHFPENTEKYLELQKKYPKLTTPEVMEKFKKAKPEARNFPETWKDYLKELETNEKTIASKGYTLSHCVKFNECEFNEHTDLCKRYRAHILENPNLQELDKTYREWRKSYRYRPKKPAFKYPSAKKLPMPKIFGSKFYNPDFDSSIIGLRLDDMPEGKFVKFGFKPWPDDYSPQPDELDISSVQVSFVGTRARIGFHFNVSHSESRFNVSQDEIDLLRSQKYPRAKQDQKFLDEARKLLLDSFQGNDPEKNLRIMAVDLGINKGSVGIFKGKEFKTATQLTITKLEKLYDSPPKVKKNGKEKKTRKELEREKQRGLSIEHVGQHLESWKTGATEIAEHRKKYQKIEDPKLGEHDMRRLSLHMRWMIRDWVRLNTSQIIKIAEDNNVDLIVFESMRDFKVPGYDELNELTMKKKRELAYFAHGRIRRKTTEKAVERGMRVITTPYKYSSQTCANCAQSISQQYKNKWRDNKLKKGIFKCEHCSNKCNSDKNAAKVLARVFWGEIKLPVE